MNRVNPTSRNKLNSLYYELKLVREEIYKVTTTARKNLCDLEKAFILDGLEKKENYILLLLMNEKGILSPLSN